VEALCFLEKCNSKEELTERIEDFKESGTLTQEHCANCFCHVGQNVIDLLAGKRSLKIGW